MLQDCICVVFVFQTKTLWYNSMMQILPTIQPRIIHTPACNQVRSDGSKWVLLKVSKEPITIIVKHDWDQRYKWVSMCIYNDHWMCCNMFINDHWCLNTVPAIHFPISFTLWPTLIQTHTCTHTNTRTKRVAYAWGVCSFGLGVTLLQLFKDKEESLAVIYTCIVIPCVSPNMQSTVFSAQNDRCTVDHLHGPQQNMFTSGAWISM